MKRLSKAQEKEHQDRIEAVSVASTALQTAVESFNSLLEAEREKVAAAQELLNEAISDADSFRQEILGEIDDYISDRSEKWQEGDTGQAYSQWKSDWEQSLEAVELEMPEPIPDPECSALEILENLSQEVVV